MALLQLALQPDTMSTRHCLVDNLSALLFAQHLEPNYIGLCAVQSLSMSDMMLLYMQGYWH